MESSIWVAVMTTLRALLHFSMIIFGRRSLLQPRFPTPCRRGRRMMPRSDTARISSKLSRPSWDSDDLGDDLDGLATVGLQVLTDFQHVFLLRMKAAMKSTPCSQPKIRSRLSFSAGAGS